MSDAAGRRDRRRRRTASTTSRWPRPPRSPAALDPAAYDVVPLTIDRDGTWRDRRQRPIGLSGAARAAARLRRRLPGRARPARRGRHAGRAVRARRACPTSAPASGPARWPWTSGRPSWSPARVGIATAPGDLVTAATAAHAPVDAPGRRQAGRRRVQPRRQPGRRTRRAAPGPRRPRSRSTTGCWSRTSSSGREIDVAVLAPPRRHARSSRRRSRSSSTASSTTTRSTTAAPTSGSPRRSTTVDAKALERRRAARCTTRSAAPAWPASTSSSPRTARCSTRSTRCPASPSSRRCRGCSPPPGRRTPTCSTSWSAAPRPVTASATLGHGSIASHAPIDPAGGPAMTCAAPWPPRRRLSASLVLVVGLVEVAYVD